MFDMNNRKEMEQRTDPIILAEDCVITGGIGEILPNYNVMVVGCSGTGKSLSVNYPTLFEMKENSVIATFAKQGEAQKMAHHFKRKGYETYICNLSNPEKGNIFFDPLQYISSFSDIEDLANKSVMSVIQKTVDDYWQRKSVPLIGLLVAATLMIMEKPTFADVLKLFDRMQITECDGGIATGLDRLFEKLRKREPDSYAVREYYNFRSLPIKTASCIRDTAAACLATMYPVDIRESMRSKNSIDFRRLATERTALIIILSPVNTSTACFSNLIYATAIKQLLTFAAERESCRLPREVRLVFDDFAVNGGGKIQGFAEYISVFRSAGISSIILVQSESQLIALYGEQDGQTIINNVSTYCYFSGGMDLTTCDHVAKRMNLSLDRVLYSPLDKIYIMQAGHEPRVTKRYPILSDKRYLEMSECSIQKKDSQAKSKTA